MKRIVYLTILLTGLLLSSCTKKAPTFVNTIPDNAVLVASLHPGQLYEKGGIASLENLKKEVDDDFARALLEDPQHSGLMIDEYSFLFVYLENESPVIGTVTGVRNKEKLESTIKEIGKEEELLIQEHAGFRYIMPEDDDVALAWNDEKLIFLAFKDAYVMETKLAELDRLFKLPKEESITTMVDFKGFLKNMKDINIWVSSNELKTILQHMDKDIQVNLPMTLDNNYGHVYCEFADGALYIDAESHFSEEIQKNIDQFLVMKDRIDPKLLQMAPGGNLLMAMGGGIELEKVRNLVDQFAPQSVDSLGSSIEEATGMTPQELWQAFTGDFIIAVNGTEANPTLPVEIFIGLGVDDATIQKKLMEKMGTMDPVEGNGDFFMLNYQGNEIYSGIIDGVWVLTNSKGYSAAIKSGKLEKTLNDTRFSELATSPIAMYMNLQLEDYPMMIQNTLRESAKGNEMLDYVSASFKSMLMTSANNKSNFTLETAKPGENSLYTLLRLSEIDQE